MQEDVLESLLPDWLPSTSSATVDVDGEPPHSFHLDADAALEPPRTDAWIDTEGRIETGPEGFRSTGTLALEPPQPRDARGLHEVEVEAEGHHHVLRGRHVVPAGGVWRSGETAERAVVNTVESLAASADVDADVEVESYSRTEEEVEIGYRGELLGVDRGAADTVHRWFGGPRDVDDTELHIDRMYLERASEDGETRYSWDVEATGHLPLSVSLAEQAGWSRAEEVAGVRREEGFGVELDWMVHLGDEVSVSVDYDAVNGRGYVDALRSAGFAVPPESELHIEMGSGDAGRYTELRYGSEDGSAGAEGSVGGLERWRAMTPAPLLPVVSYYVSR